MNWKLSLLCSAVIVSSLGACASEDDATAAAADGAGKADSISIRDGLTIRIMFQDMAEEHLWGDTLRILRASEVTRVLDTSVGATVDYLRGKPGRETFFVVNVPYPRTDEALYLATDHWIMPLEQPNANGQINVGLSRLEFNHVEVATPQGTSTKVVGAFSFLQNDASDCPAGSANVRGAAEKPCFGSTVATLIPRIDQLPPAYTMPIRGRTGTGIWIPKGDYVIKITYEDALGQPKEQVIIKRVLV